VGTPASGLLGLGPIYLVEHEDACFVYCATTHFTIYGWWFELFSLDLVTVQIYYLHLAFALMLQETRIKNIV